MMFRTHLVLGVFVALFFLKTFTIENQFLFIFFVCLSAVLPDIDIPKSKIGKKVKPLSWILNFLFGHRGIFHSLVLSFFFFMLLILLFKNYIGAAFFLGYSAHLFADGITIRGIKPLYPFSTFRVRGPVRSGGMLDYLFFFLITLGIILFLIS